MQEASLAGNGAEENIQEMYKNEKNKNFLSKSINATDPGGYRQASGIGIPCWGILPSKWLGDTQ
jgi:hypothetical protein